MRILKRKYTITTILAVYIASKLIRPGYIISTAEEGILFYNISRTFDLYKNAWVDSSLGFYVPFIWSRIPVFWVFNLLSKLGMSGWQIQGLLFFLLLYTPLYFVPKLAEIFVGKDKPMIGFSASLLYLFNYFTITQVLHRFVYAPMFYWAFLPLFLYLFFKNVEKITTKRLIYFVIANAVFSYGFSHPASVIVLWVPAYLYVLSKYLVAKELKYFKNTLVITLVWLLTNLWWIYPMLSSGGSQQVLLQNPDPAISSLTEVSAYFPNSEIFFLRQKFYFDSGYFNFLMNTPRAQIASILMLGFMAAGVLLSLFKRKYIFLVVLLCVGWFVSKGVNPPLGTEFYNFMFSRFGFFRVLRNSYEKFGVVFMLPYVMLAAIAIVRIPQKFINKPAAASMLSLGVLLFIVVGLGRPIYTGEVFFGYYYIDVPEYYRNANELIVQRSEGRILHLPYRRFPAIKYEWGYQGEEPSRFLFDRPSIAGVTSHKSTEDLLAKLPQYFEQQKFSRVLNLMNIDSIVIHRDYVQDKYYPFWIDRSQEFVTVWEGTNFLESSGDLDIYKLSFEKDLGIINLSDELIEVKSISDALELMIDPEFIPSRQSIFVADQNKSAPMREIDTGRLPQFSFEKLSSRKYIVEIDDAEDPYILILSNGFDDHWVAESGDEAFGHFEVNGFANGWYIDKSGSYTIVVEFEVWPWEKY